MSKKAILEIQFHWVFILIVGAVILLFFATLIYKQRTVSEKGISADVLINLESIISGSMISTKTLNLLDVPKGTEINYKDCNTYSTGPFSKPTKTIVMFAPETITGRKLVTWALDWNVPYRVTNFLYLSSNEVRYILVLGYKSLGAIDIIYSDLMLEIDSDIMPDEITRDAVYFDYNDNKFYYLDDTEIRAKGNYKVRFVFYNTDPSTITIPPGVFDNLRSLDLTAVNIIPGVDNRIGTVTFYKKGGDKFVEYTPSYSQPYLKKEAIIGAIFAENPETYECAMQKAFRRLHHVTKVYYDRTEDLYNYYSDPDLPIYLQRCTQSYELTALDEISTGSESFTSDNVNRIYIYAYEGSPPISSLEQQNRALQLRSCPPIY